ncbi:hypothetical protein GCM10010172_76000 [Paractinoplanes ferrugineus]|uniref:HNH nuclease domain-containing protein n=1 Tax=Paractinoplanes ferrugineus TaxID=113564 RepID=A0A919IYN2_9ACTN|nr:DUF222 domain-containing protein [Actinoplanes ferrugineus]GIE11245.1 hypothetical protein Afe05nite_30850 [Actinoplanes ferrugineus]
MEGLVGSRAALSECAEAAVWALPDAELLACLDEAWAGVRQVTAIAARLVRQAEVRGIPQIEAASSTVVWLRQRLRMSPATGQRLAALGAALDGSAKLDTAVSAGAVATDQALAIASAMGDLPPEAGRDLLDKAESALISFACEFDPVTLGRLGARILSHVDPDAADRHDEEATRRQLARARRKRAFTLSPLGDGTVRLAGSLEATAAAIVNSALSPLCHPGRDVEGSPRTPVQRRADALVEVCALALRTGELPTSAGEAAQVVVTIPIETLQTGDRDISDAVPAHATRSEEASSGRGTRPAGGSPSGPPAGRVPRAEPAGNRPTGNGPAGNGPAGNGPAGNGPRSAGQAPTRAGRRPDRGGPGRLDDGSPISAAEARQLACDAQIIPAVLGTAGQVLDLGRARRLLVGPIRRALNLRDGGCSFPGCDRPPGWANAHHIVPWADGGETALSNACLLCRHHHTLVHQTEWEVRLDADGFPEFVPPAGVDPERRPRQKAFYRRQ